MFIGTVDSRILNWCFTGQSLIGWERHLAETTALTPFLVRSFEILERIALGLNLKTNFLADFWSRSVLFQLMVASILDYSGNRYPTSVVSKIEIIWSHLYWLDYLWSQIMTNRLKNSQFFRLFGCFWDRIKRIWNGMKSKNFNGEQKIRLQVFEFEFFFEFDCWLDHFFNFRFQNLKQVYTREKVGSRNNFSGYVPATKSVATTSSSFLIAIKYHQNKSPCDFVSFKKDFKWFKKLEILPLPELSWGGIDLNWRFLALYFLKWTVRRSRKKSVDFWCWFVIL